MNVLCPHCDQPVLYEDATAGKELACPHCGQAFHMPRVTLPAAKPARAAPPEVPWARLYQAPPYFMPLAIFLLILAAFAFAASFYVGSSGGRGHLLEAGLLAGALNPLFFLAAPLGAYFCYKAFLSGSFYYCPHCGEECARVARPLGTVMSCPTCRHPFRKP